MFGLSAVSRFTKLYIFLYDALVKGSEYIIFATCFVLYQTEKHWLFINLYFNSVCILFKCLTHFVTGAILILKLRFFYIVNRVFQRKKYVLRLTQPLWSCGAKHSLSVPLLNN